VTAEIFPNMLEVTSMARETFDRIFTLGQAPVSEMIELSQKVEALQMGTASVPADCNCPAGALPG